MVKLIKEAALDDSFNVQMGKVQGAVSQLENIIAGMRANRMTKMTDSQKRALRNAAEDFKRLYESAI